LSGREIPLQIEHLTTWDKIRAFVLMLLKREERIGRNPFYGKIDLIKQNSIDR